MSIDITISGTVIPFPSDGQSPDWAQAVIDFAQAVETALQGVSGAYDVAPQVLNIDAYNTPSSGIDIPNLSFSTTIVRAVQVQVATYRNTDSGTYAEYSTLNMVYNADNDPGSKWEVSREGTGDGHITFLMSDDGQVSFEIVDALSGTGYTGLLSYSAKALLNT